MLFYDWRYLPGEKPNPEFPLNFPRYKGASVLARARQFRLRLQPRACALGHSRLRLPLHHRARAMPTFSTTTASRTAFCPSRCSDAQIDDLFKRAEKQEGYRLTVDLENQVDHRRQRLAHSFRDRSLPQKFPAQRSRRYRPHARARAGYLGVRKIESEIRADVRSRGRKNRRTANVIPRTASNQTGRWQ